MLGENREGLITSWSLHEETRNDDKLLAEALKQTSENTGMPVRLMCGDRGFANKAIQQNLAEEDPERKDHVAARGVAEFAEQMKDGEFRKSQTRRGQTRRPCGDYQKRLHGRAESQQGNRVPTPGTCLDHALAQPPGAGTQKNRGAARPRTPTRDQGRSRNGLS